jgi:hypothetical protein
MKNWICCSICCSICCLSTLSQPMSEAQQFVPNYDESRVPDFPLPELLRFGDGRAVTHSGQWEERRIEILRLLSAEMFGDSPPSLPVAAELIESSARPVVQGKGMRKQIRLTISGRAEPAESVRGKITFDLLIYLPASAPGPVPVFLGLNFRGNHSISDDPEVLIPDSWVPNLSEFNVKGNRSNEQVRGTKSSRWPVERILDRGYGLVTCYYGDIDPDFDDGFNNGVHALFPHSGRLYREPDNRQPAVLYSWGSIAGWAWGLSRIMDYLESDPQIDTKRVALLGHSRLGKTALWAGAQDTRFGLVISNNSGCGGAALSRRRFGETVWRINQNFPHWFCEKFKRYSDNENALPFDQHFLIAAMAPRPVYIASAEEDLWADPLGEFLAAREAEPAYQLWGLAGLQTAQPPPVDQPVGQSIGYHRRSGVHDVTEFDWHQFLNFADRHWKTD